jgi:Spy/CpxP family protein refolding chaperone
MIGRRTATPLDRVRKDDMSFGVQGITDPSQPGGSTSGTGLRRFAGLNLSEDQRTQIRAIVKNAKSQGLSESQVQDQIDQVLTPDQQAALQSAQSQSQTQAQTQNGPFSNLDLTQSQKQQIDQILQTAKTQGLAPSVVQTQINAVLTPAQQQTLQTDVQNAQSAHSGRHHHHHGGGGSASSTTGATSVNGLTEADVQNQVAAANSVTQQQLQTDLSS